MSFFSVPAVLAWLVFPSVFAGLVAALRIASAARAMPADAGEKAALALMLAPFAIGAAAALLPSPLPEITLLPALPLKPLVPAGGGSGEAARAAGVRPGILLAVCGTGYAGVAAFRLARIVRAHVRLRRVAARARPSGFGADIALTEEMASPVVDRRGLILLPSALAGSLSADEIAMIAAHERAHHARGDQLWFVILAVLDALLWAHPAIRWQTARCRLAAELACDAAACGPQPQMRRAYAELIVRALKHAAGNALPCAPAVFSPRTKGEIGMRLTEIMRPVAGRGKPGGRIALLAAGALCLPLAAVQYASATSAPGTAFSVAPLASGKVTSAYGGRVDPISNEVRMHQGTDIAAPMGTPVRAPAAGVVSRVVQGSGGYGNLLEITHEGGVITRYGQLEGFDVAFGDRVYAGQDIARVGASGRATGPHLHIEVLIDGERVDPAKMIALPKAE